MAQTAYIFMDFDGVTHPWGEVEDFRCLPLIEAVVRDYDEARIVIASDWRMLFSLSKLVSRFAEDIRPKVVGATPHMLPKHGAELHGLREREAMLMTRSRLLLTDFKRGFNDEDALALRKMLDGFRVGVPALAPVPHSALRWA